MKLTSPWNDKSKADSELTNGYVATSLEDLIETSSKADSEFTAGYVTTLITI